MYSDADWERRSSSLNIAGRDRKMSIDAMDEIKRAIEVAEKLPFRFLIQHIGVSGEDFNMHKFDAAMTSIEHLRAFAKPLGVRLLLENIPNELSTPENSSSSSASATSPTSASASTPDTRILKAASHPHSRH